MRSIWRIHALIATLIQTAPVVSQPANTSSATPRLDLATSIFPFHNATSLTSAIGLASDVLESLQTDKLSIQADAIATTTGADGGLPHATSEPSGWLTNSNISAVTNTTLVGSLSHENETAEVSSYTFMKGADLKFVLDSAPPKFDYETAKPAPRNWIAFYPKGASPGVEGDTSYAGYQYAPDSKGSVAADQDMDQCLEAGDYEAYLFQWGNKAAPLAGPIAFRYQGTRQFQKCSDGRCIRSDQSCGADMLSYVDDSAPPKFDYETAKPAPRNWIAFYPKGASPGVEGDTSYAGYQYAPDSKGSVAADQDMDQCLEAGDYEAYLFQWGNKAAPLAGPIAFRYQGTRQFQKCSDGKCIRSDQSCGCPDPKWECGNLCISKDELCNGQCPPGRKECRGKCIDDGEACDDICDSPEPGLNWRFDKYLDGNGPGRIGSNHYWTTRTYGPNTVDLDYTFSGPPVASIKGTTHDIGWKGGFVDSTASVYGQPLPGFRCASDQTGLVGTACGTKAEHFVLHHTGYFVPEFSGTYTFAFAAADDVAYMWLGPDAISNYTMANYQMFVDHEGWKAGQTNAEYHFDATKGVAVPIRVSMVASWGFTHMTFTVKNPNGQIIMESLSEPNDPQTRISREFKNCNADWQLSEASRKVVSTPFPERGEKRCDGSPLSGLQWRYEKYLDGSGLGRLPDNRDGYYGSRTYGPSTSNLDLTFAGKPIATVDGITQAVGWRGGCVAGTASIHNQPLPDFRCADDQTGRAGSACGDKAEHFVIQYTGTFIPQTSGTYTFAFAVADDVAYMWLGPDAISNYTMANHQMFVDHTSWRAGQTKAEYQFDAKKGMEVPIRVAMVGSWGWTYVTFTVKNPNGQIIIGSLSKPNDPQTRISSEFVACFT